MQTSAIAARPDAQNARRLVANGCLYVAGTDLFNPFPQPAQHFPRQWALHVEHLDLIGYRRFYDGPPAPALHRLARGLRALATERLTITQQANIRQIAIRKLRLPALLDVLFQDLWILANLQRHLAPSYDIAIVHGPESALLSRYLQRTGRAAQMVYHDIDYYPYVSTRQRRIIAWREQMLVRTADLVLSVSRPLAALRTEQGARRVVYLPNGVDFDRFAQANKRQPGRPPTLLYTGTLDRRWGVDLPIRAMPLILKHYPETRCFIAGAGPDEANLRHLVETLKLQHAVHFLGFVSHSDLPGIMAQADIGLATSREDLFRQYASPLKLAEYMAAGLPVICSGGGEAAQIITESGAGVNVPFSPDACAAAICALLGHPDELQAQREAGLAYARARTWENLAAQFAQVVAALPGPPAGNWQAAESEG